MFTGLIETLGKVANVTPLSGGLQLTIAAPDILQDAKLGDSIAINGACTTVIALTPETFTIEASPETLSKTNFGLLKIGQQVNIERPLTPQSRLGGHYVTGHVDGLATLLDRSRQGISWVMTFEVQDPDMARLLVPKGSVALDGISLTVNTVADCQFTVAIIPHTMTHTNLGEVAVGETVHVETDLLGKYVQKLTSPYLPEAQRDLDTAFLSEHGFLTPSPQ